jgi:hypothetical protein
VNADTSPPLRGAGTQLDSAQHHRSSLSAAGRAMFGWGPIPPTCADEAAVSRA